MQRTHWTRRAIPRGRSLLATLAWVVACAAPALSAGQSAEGRDAFPIPLAPRIPEAELKESLPSGLSYSVLAPGLPPESGGRHPRPGDCVFVHYHAWRPDGALHDSTWLRNQRVRTWVGRSIAGWNEILPRMTIGSRFLVEVPAALNDAREGVVPQVPRGEPMCFEIELVDAIFVPEFHAARPEAAVVTPGGLTYEVLRPGIGDAAPDRERVLRLDFGLWTTEGKLLDCSARQGTWFEIKRAQFDVFWEIAFMKEAFSLLRPGSRLRFTVPPAQAFGARENPGLPGNSVTVWEFELLEVMRPLPLPAFERPAPAAALVTESGLVYRVVREGTGPRPLPDTAVSVNYAIWLVDGKLFDSSFERGVPARLDLADPGMLPGLRECLLLMPEGAVVRCELPPELAYGETGWSPHIGPQARLVLYVELARAG